MLLSLRLARRGEAAVASFQWIAKRRRLGQRAAQAAANDFVSSCSRVPHSVEYVSLADAWFELRPV